MATQGYFYGSVDRLLSLLAAMSMNYSKHLPAFPAGSLLLDFEQHLLAPTRTAYAFDTSPGCISRTYGHYSVRAFGEQFDSRLTKCAEKIGLKVHALPFLQPQPRGLMKCSTDCSSRRSCLLFNIASYTSR